MVKFKYLLFSLLIFSSSVFAAVPSGYYYFAKNKSKAELKTALHIHGAPLKVLNYGGDEGFTWQGFYYTDNRNDTVIDMYSNIIRKFNGYGSIAGMHIEHSFPKSWWGSHVNDAYKDLFHLYPADGITNSTKNNFPLGEVLGTPILDNGVSKIGDNGFGTSYTGKCFEPADEYKGDFARSYLYISTIYQDLAPLWQSPMMNNNTYPVWKKWGRDLLLKWHQQDPVSEKELERNEQVYEIQGNRNPFIDYPTLVSYIWGVDTTKVFPFPEETNAFFISPRRGTSLDFGVILVNDKKTILLNLLGVNISSTLNLSIKNSSPAFSLLSNTISSQQALNGYNLELEYSPSTPGFSRDTLLISDGGLTQALAIPILALASADFITLEPKNITAVGATLKWMTDPKATDYHLSVYQGDKVAGGMIISSYVEGSSWNKAIELYNGTGEAIDLSKYSLRKQSNGAGYFGSTLRLSGNLADKTSYLISHINATNSVLISKAALRTDTVLQMNGNDAIELLRNGVPIDRVGMADAGADVYWGLDLSLQRKKSVTHPITNFSMDEWNVLRMDSVEFLGNHQMNLISGEPNSVFDGLVGNNSIFEVENLSPSSTYTYSVEAIRTDGNKKAVNTMQVHTSALEAPVVMQASDISYSGFTANWEDALYSNDYLLDVFQLIGKEDVTEIEGFDDLGTSGNPLPEGWLGKVSGNYTTATSSGVNPPSAGLKNSADWLQTKTYASPVSRFTYMYRFASAATGSYFLMDGWSNAQWIRVDSIAYSGTTAKFYPVYTFNPTDNYQAFRFTYIKSSGNLAIDDVEATFGSQELVYVFQDKAVTGSFYPVVGLNENNTYNYRVRNTLGAAVSDYSETMELTTLVQTAVETITDNPFKFNIQNNQIHLSNLKGNEQIGVYSVTGFRLLQMNATSSVLSIPFGHKGMFIMSVKKDGRNWVAKFIN